MDHAFESGDLPLAVDPLYLNEDIRLAVFALDNSVDLD